MRKMTTHVTHIQRATVLESGLGGTGALLLFSADQ